MQKLAEICIRRPVFASMIVLSLVVIGAALEGVSGGWIMILSALKTLLEGGKPVSEQ